MTCTQIAYVTHAQRRALELMPLGECELRSKGVRSFTLKRLRDAGLCFFGFTSERWQTTEVGRIALDEARKLAPQPCGGQLHPTRLGRPGDSVACPSCGKAVTLRRPFNGNNTGWVQVPRHNRASPAKAERNAYFAEWESNIAKTAGSAA